MGWKVRLQGEFERSGFLFLCMKQGEKLGITGEAEFVSDNEVRLHLYGTEVKLNDFLEWSKKSLYPQEVETLEVCSIGYSDEQHFKIL